MNDIKKDFEAWGVLFAIYKLVLFENRVMGVMFQLKTGNGRKRKDTVGLHNLYCLSGSRVSKNGGKWVRNAACMGVKVILKRVLIGKHEGKSPFRRPVCMWDDKLKWILRNFIRVYFDYSCFGRALNDSLITLHNEP